MLLESFDRKQKGQYDFFYLPLRHGPATTTKVDLLSPQLLLIGPLLRVCSAQS